MSFCSEKGIPHSEWLSWSAVDRAKTIAFLLERSETCQLCGTAPWEWEENRFAYEPSEHYCHGCYLKDIASEGAGSMPGTTIELIPVTDQYQAEQQLARERRSQMDMGDQEDGQ